MILVAYLWSPPVICSCISQAWSVTAVVIWTQFHNPRLRHALTIHCCVAHTCLRLSLGSVDSLLIQPFTAPTVPCHDLLQHCLSVHVEHVKYYNLWNKLPTANWPVQLCWVTVVTKLHHLWAPAQIPATWPLRCLAQRTNCQIISCHRYNAHSRESRLLMSAAACHIHDPSEQRLC